MKTKLIAAVLAALICASFIAGCGQSKPSGTESSSASSEAQSSKDESYSYEVSNIHFSCKTDIQKYISGEAADFDSLAESIDYEKTNKTNQWTIASNGVRILATLGEPKDGVISSITFTASKMDGTKNDYKFTYAGSDSDKFCKIGDNKIPEPLIAVAAYALEKAPDAANNDPFSTTFKNYKNDKGEYVLSDKAE